MALAVASLGLALALVPAVAGARASEDPVSTTVVPTSAVTTTVVPTTVTAVAPEGTLAVGSEAAYRAALATLSADSSGPHRIDLTADIAVDDGTDPTYTGTQPLTVSGAGHILDAIGTSRLLVVDSPTDAALRLAGVTMRNALGAGDGGAVLVMNGSTVEIIDSGFESNEASGSGGAVAVPVEATVIRSDFVANRAGGGDGGALDAAGPAGRFRISDSQFFRNAAPLGDGGAVSAFGSDEIGGGDEILRSTFFDNRARRGGALVLVDQGEIVNTTIVDNTASLTGGGLLVETSSVAAGIYLTVTGNAAPEGANLTYRGDAFVLAFSVFAEPRGAGTNCLMGGDLTGQQLHDDDGSCRPDSEGDPRLGPLTANGGRTLTREPLPGSPLIDAVPANFGFPSIPGGCAAFQQVDPHDQRGVLRPQDGDGRSRPDFAQGVPIDVAADCDIGAVEARAFVPPPTGPVPGAPPFTG